MVSGYDKNPPPKFELEPGPGGRFFWFVVFACVSAACVVVIVKAWALIF